jgi:hypothetical protein
LKKEIQKRNLIQKTDKMKKNISYIFICLMLTNSCSVKVIQISVTEYIQVDKEYQYSDFLYFNNLKYKPIVKSVYSNDSIESFSIFKSEGEVYYEKSELKNDTLLVNTLNIVEVRKIKQDNSMIIDNNKVYNITEQKKDSFFCLSGEKLYVFQFNCNKR